jgi:c-di-GMP-binding flagellar brake protein YcgR
MAMNYQRRYERVPFLCNVTMAVLPGGTPLAACTLDLSVGGAGLIAQSPFQPGQLVAISFFLKDAGHKEVVDRITGRVVHLRADVDGNRVGVEFLEPLDEARHPELMSRLLKA